MNCKICQKPTSSFANAKIRSQYQVAYFRCAHCGFIQTEDPYWLAEAYQEAINQSDTGLLQRNILMANITGLIIRFLIKERGNFIDYGSGYGLFVRLMRDKGFSFRWFDTYCQNIFARGFEHHQGLVPYHLLTAFEVMEHLVDPLQEIPKMLKLSPNILFSTLLLPSPVPAPQEWWYYGLEHGQHISFYTRASLEVIASHFGLYLYSNPLNRQIHLLSEKKCSPFLFSILSNLTLSSLFQAFIPSHPLDRPF